jgi:hypothetical protein
VCASVEFIVARICVLSADMGITAADKFSIIPYFYKYVILCKFVQTLKTPMTTVKKLEAEGSSAFLFYCQY